MNELDFDDLPPAAQDLTLLIEPETTSGPVAAGTTQDRYLGVYPGMPEKEYRRAPGMNKSGIDNFMRSPLHYQTIKKTPPPPTPQMFVGSAFHTLVLEPDRFDSECVADKHAGSQSAAAKAWRDEQRHKGLTVISTRGDADIWNASDWDMIHYMRDAVMMHPVASLLIQGDVEQSVFWVDKTTYKLCKGRIDVHNQDHNVLVDLKSAADASYSGFQRAVHSYHYMIQDAFYSDGWMAATKAEKVLPFIFVVVEKQPPYGVGCYALEPEWRRVGREIYTRTLEKYKDCMLEDAWPCYPEEVRDLIIPGFAKYHAIS